MKQFRSWPLLWSSSALLIGIALGSTGYHLALQIVLSVLCVLGLIGCFLSLVRNLWWRDVVVLGLLIALGASYAAVRTATRPLIVASIEVRDVSAVVVSSSSVTSTGQRLFIDLLDLDSGAPIRVRATLRGTDQLRYGELITISGFLEPPRDSPQFHETGYLRAHHAQGTILADTVELIGERRGNIVLRALHDTQTRLLGRLRTIHAPERAVVAGIVLGENGLLPEWLEEAFRQTGTTHMLVASGSNVAILAWMIEHLLAVFGLRFRLFITSLLLLGFVVMTGGDASIVRAVVLYLIVILATLCGRRVHLPTLVAGVALGMALYTPWIVVYDASFQLSFAAVLGLIILSDWFATRLPTWWLKEFLAPTLAAQVATLPILLFSFGQLSVVAPIVNLLTVPLVLPIMAGGIVTLVLPWSRFIPWLTEGVTALLLWIVSTGARIPWASVTTETHRLLWSSIALAILVGLVFVRYRTGRDGVRRELHGN